MKTKTAIKKLAKKDGAVERARKALEELRELSEATTLWLEGKRRHGPAKTRKHLVEEAADVSVCLDALIYALKARKAFKTVRAFKTQRELCRRWLKNPRWCATNPNKEEAK